MLLNRPYECELRQIEEVGAVVRRLDVEELGLPVFARLDDVGTFVLMLATGDKAAAAVGHVSLVSRLAAFCSRRNQVAGPSIVHSEVEEPLPESHTRTASEEAFAQCDEHGEHHNEVGRQMVRL